MLGCSLEKWEDGNMEGAEQAAGSFSSPRKGRLDFRREPHRVEVRAEVCVVVTRPWMGETRTC